MIYKILLIFSALLLILSLKKRKKIKRKHTIKDVEERINKALHFFQHKKDSKEYKHLEKNIKAAGINISPETFQSMNIIVSIAAAGLTVLFQVLIYINIILNTDVISAAAEALDNPDIKNISFNIDFKPVLIIFVAVYFLPRIFLKISAELKKAISEKEILLLQSYTVIMLKANIPTKEILVALYNRSNVFKLNFETAVKKYSTDPEAAIKELKESSDSNNFRKTCISLEQSLKSDKLTSLVYLENNRIFTKEINKQHRLRKNKRNEIIGTLLMIFPLFMLVAIGAYPWIIHILRLLNSMPM